jgi:hypothetical protein
MAYTANVGFFKDSFTSSLPTTQNFLRPNAFRFSLKDLPHTSFTCQSANIPQLAFGVAVQATPFYDIPRIGEKMSFGDLSIRFIIAEDMSNYLEIYNWMVALGFPKSYNQFDDYLKTKPTKSAFITNKDGQSEVLAYSDATLSILDSTNNPKISIIYKDAFPISLESLDYDIASSGVEYLTAIATFKFRIFEIEVL